MAAVEKLPLVVVVANNQYAYSTPNNRQFACANLVDRAIGYGVTGHTAHGVELEDCLDVVGKAVAAARAGGGPQLVVADLLRLVGHGEHDDAAYITAEQKSSLLGRDCLLLAEAELLSNKLATAEEIATWVTDIEQEIETITARVLREPPPDPEEETWIPFATDHLHSHFIDAAA